MEATEDARISETFSKCAVNGPPKGSWLSVPGDFIKYFRVGRTAHTRSYIEQRSVKKKIFFKSFTYYYLLKVKGRAFSMWTSAIGSIFCSFSVLNKVAERTMKKLLVFLCKPKQLIYYILFIYNRKKFTKKIVKSRLLLTFIILATKNLLSSTTYSL